MLVRPVTFSILRSMAAAPARPIMAPSTSIFQRTISATPVAHAPKRDARVFSLGLPVKRDTLADEMGSAICHNQPGDFERLVKSNKETVLEYGHDLIVLAASQQRWNMIQILANEGISLETPDCDGNPPLHKFDHQDDCEKVRKLQELGADINGLDSFGRTLLNKVIANIYFVPPLIELGANVHLGIIPAIHTRFYQSQRTLLHHLSVLPNTSKALKISLTQAGVQAKNWVNTADTNGSTPLMEALEHRYLGHASILLQHQADPNRISHFGKSAQELAKIMGLPELKAGVPMEY